MELSGKTAVVTGGARGIGRAIALRLAMGRAAVVVVDCDETEGHRAVAEINAAGCEASFVGADVTRDEDVEAMIGETERRYAGLDVLVNNAGGYEQPVFPDAPLEQWARTLDLNLRSVMVATQFAVRAMERRGGGAIVNIASTAGLGLSPHPGPEYAVAKAGVMRLTACLTPLLARAIRVNCVCPHTVGTEAVRQTIAKLKAEGRELPLPLQAVLIEPEEIAEAVVDIIRDESLAGRVMLYRGGEARLLLPNLPSEASVRLTIGRP
jgi:NAD(P)-dependent dehydrogenase (short-subunit alcohol dehydrogenase family)